MTKKISNSEELVLIMAEAVKEKKGDNIKILDLRGLDYAVTDFFIVCEAQSSTQINAIFESIDDIVKQKLNQDPFQIEGKEEASWILMDYVDVVAHIFKPEAREFYRLEALWADAKIKSINY